MFAGSIVSAAGLPGCSLGAPAGCSRGTLVYAPLSCACTSAVATASTPLAAASSVKRSTPSSSRALNLTVTAAARPPAAVAAAAAVLGPSECASAEGSELHAADPSLWLEDLQEEVDQAAAAAAAQSDEQLSSVRDKQGHYLGVYEVSSASQPASSNNSSNMRNSNKPRGPSRGRLNTKARGKLMQQYGSVLEQFEAEHTAWLHQQEQEFTQLLATGASQSELHQQEARQHRQQQNLTSRWQQQWGPPVVRTQLLQAAHPRKHQQQQQGEPAAQASSSSNGSMRQLFTGSAASRSDQQQQQQQQGSAAPRQAAGVPQQHPQQQTGQQQHQHQQRPRSAPAGGWKSNSSSSSSSRPRRSSVFDIPDVTPELGATSAAAAAEAAAVQRFSNHTVGASLVAKALSQEPIDRAALDGLEVVFLHLALPRLVQWKLHHLLPRLVEYLLARPDMNQHTCGAVFNAYALVNRLDLAMATWNELAGRGFDIGPFGSSALIKACARARNIGAALQVFDQLLRRRVSFNAYTYNCLLQLCASAGRMDDALAVYNLQRLETEPANLPDAYTYNALMRGVLVSGSVELTQQLFENMLEDGVAADPPLYCNFINAAGRAGNLGLARYLYQHMMLSLNLAAGSSGSSSSASSMASSSAEEAEDDSLQESVQQQQPQQQFPASKGSSSAAVAPNMLTMVNALLFAHAQVGAFQSALLVFQQELLGRGLQPDAYTCTALLTAASRVSNLQLSWEDVQQIVGLIQRYEIQLTTQLGTALINAYRRVRVWQRPQQQQEDNAGRSSSNMAQLQQKHVKGRKARRGHAAAAEAAADQREGEAAVAAAAAAEEAAEHAAQQQQEQEQRELQLLAAAGGAPLHGVRPVVAASLHAARQALRSLQEFKLATSNSYVMMLCFLLEQGQFGAFKQLYIAMKREGVHPDEQGWERLLFAAGESGMQDTVQQMMQQAESPASVDYGAVGVSGVEQQQHEEEQERQQQLLQLQRMREMQQAGVALQQQQQQQQQAPRERKAR